MSFLSGWMAPVVHTRGSIVYVENIDTLRLRQYVFKTYGSNTFVGKFFHSKHVYKYKISCDLFFVPELLYILEEADRETHKFSKAIKEIRNNTWMKDADVVNFMQDIEHPTDGLFDYLKSVVSKIRSIV